MKRRYRTLPDYFLQTGSTQEALARKLGITPSYMSLLASGRRQPSLALALRIESITGVPAAALVLVSSQEQPA